MSCLSATRGLSTHLRSICVSLLCIATSLCARIHAAGLSLDSAYTAITKTCRTRVAWPNSQVRTTCSDMDLRLPHGLQSTSCSGPDIYPRWDMSALRGPLPRPSNRVGKADTSPLRSQRRRGVTMASVSPAHLHPGTSKLAPRPQSWQSWSHHAPYPLQDSLVCHPSMYRQTRPSSVTPPSDARLMPEPATTSWPLPPSRHYTEPPEDEGEILVGIGLYDDRDSTVLRQTAPSDYSWNLPQLSKMSIHAPVRVPSLSTLNSTPIVTNDVLKDNAGSGAFLHLAAYDADFAWPWSRDQGLPYLRDDGFFDGEQQGGLWFMMRDGQAISV